MTTPTNPANPAAATPTTLLTPVATAPLPLVVLVPLPLEVPDPVAALPVPLVELLVPFELEVVLVVTEVIPVLGVELPVLVVDWTVVDAGPVVDPTNPVIAATSSLMPYWEARDSCTVRIEPKSEAASVGRASRKPAAGVSPARAREAREEANTLGICQYLIWKRNEAEVELKSGYSTIICSKIVEDRKKVRVCSQGLLVRSDSGQVGWSLGVNSEEATGKGEEGRRELHFEID